jgi:Zn-dependent protease with chaperone function
MRLLRSLSSLSSRVPRRVWRRAAMAALTVPLIVIATTAAMAKSRSNSRYEAANELQNLLDDMRRRLGIDRPVAVELVLSNPHIVSVVTPQDAGGPFVVKVEHAMLALLTREELEAAIAHELGHVWVFTHHPYLQTELLANQVAMRVVGRDVLIRVYEKVWARDGQKGDLIRFLGEE